MRKYIAYAVIALTLLAYGVAFAEDITGTGMSQKALYNWMSDTNTMCNELKDDVDALKGVIVRLLTMIDADNGTIGTDYNSTLGLGGNASLGDVVPADVSASDLSFTGL